MKNIGLYIHVPFCMSKCPYCDFYSMKPDENITDKYLSRINSEIIKWGNELNINADTLYFGGGTPSVLKGEDVAEIIKNAKEKFKLKEAEITVECNPSSDLDEFLPFVARAGVNRISLGLQSAVDSERRKLGRRAGKSDVVKAIQKAKSVGIDNISLDLMLGIPGQTMESLKESIDFCADTGAKHISVYMLKIEENTKFFELRDKLDLPDDDICSDMYLATCEQLGKYGFEHYEISNFAVKGYESRHNLKYWNDEEYLGFGPSAHSFVDGKRFYYDRNLYKYIENPEIINDGAGGNIEEYIMLKLRLKDGINTTEIKENFGIELSEKFLKTARKFKNIGMIEFNGEKINLTEKGFLVSNSIICELLQD